MKKQINLQTISELSQLVIADKLTDLKITAIKGELMAEYHIADAELGTSNEDIIKLSSTLKLLFNGLILNKINAFELYYSFDNNVFVSNHEIEFDEVLKNDFEKLEIIKDSLQKALVLAKDLNLEAVNANQLYEKKSLNNSRKYKYTNIDIVRALELLNESFR